MRARWIATTLATALLVGACSTASSSAAPTSAPAASADTDDGASASASAEKIKLGLITKFPVDFFFTIENAAKDWAAQHPDVELITGQGEAGNDHEGQIAIIESMVAQGVQGIAVTPTGPQVQPALDAAVEAGVKIVLIDNDLPDWTGKTAVVATDNHAGGVLAGQWLAGVLKDGDTLGVLEGVAGVPALDARVQGMLEGLGDIGVEVVQQLPDGLRPGEGRRCRRDDPHGAPGRHRHLRRVRTPDHRRPRVDREREPGSGRHRRRRLRRVPG